MLLFSWPLHAKLTIERKEECLSLKPETTDQPLYLTSWGWCNIYRNWSVRILEYDKLVKCLFLSIFVLQITWSGTTLLAMRLSHSFVPRWSITRSNSWSHDQLLTLLSFLRFSRHYWQILACKFNFLCVDESTANPPAELILGY